MDDQVPKVALRGGFSDRSGITPINTEMQLNSLDERTRIRIVNLSDYLFKFRCQPYDSDMHFVPGFISGFLAEVYLQIVDHGKTYSSRAFFDNFYNRTVLNGVYSDVLTVVEYFCDHLCGKYGMLDDGEECTFEDPYAIIPSEKFNQLFEREYVGYRFVCGLIAPITNRTEIAAINQAATTKNEIVNGHIHKAIALLSDREHPDYPNSIKESITAVEAMCNLITGQKKETLGEALKHLEDKGVPIHNALQSAFKTLYGYTSDANGIRHAGNMGGAEATFAEAKYMLVSCSGFVNYLVEVSR
ncbi:MAG: hypothetical protein PUF24_00090 [Oribacterium sp.]|nr:hypothetical protein [Oribacterium sp.]